MRARQGRMSTDAASQALKQVESTLLIVGSQGEGGAHFMVANWATQASFEPWRYVLAMKKTSRTIRNVREKKAFTVNLLDDAHKDVVKRVLKGAADGKGDESPVDAPRLPDAYAGFDCEVVDVLDTGGDHALVVADVKDGWKRGDGPPVRVDEMKLSYAG